MSPPARAPADERFAFLGDRDLQDLLRRVALRITCDENESKDVRQGAVLVAMDLVADGKGPGPKASPRGWMCRVLRNHAFEVWHEKERTEAFVEPVDVELLAAEDQRVLDADQEVVERRLAIVQEAKKKFPKYVREMMIPDGRSAEGTAKDAAARKRRSRAQTTLASFFAAALAAAIAILFVRVPGGKPPIGPTRTTDETLASSLREVATRRCGGGEWEPCVFALKEAKRLDPAGARDPHVQGLWKQGIEGLRGDALAQCRGKAWAACLEGLDLARKYDPEGDQAAVVKLARSEANGGVRAAGDGGVPDLGLRAK